MRILFCGPAVLYGQRDCAYGFFFDRYSMKRFFARRFMKTMQYLSTLLEKGFQFGLECHVQRFYVGRIFDMAAVRIVVAQL